MGNDSLEMKDKSCYLGDMISDSGGAEESCIARITVDVDGKRLESCCLY